MSTFDRHTDTARRAIEAVRPRLLALMTACGERYHSYDDADPRGDNDGGALLVSDQGATFGLYRVDYDGKGPKWSVEVCTADGSASGHTCADPTDPELLMAAFLTATAEAFAP